MAAFTAGQLAALNSYTEGLVWNGLTQALIDLNLTGIAGEWYIGKLPWLSELGPNKGIVANFDWSPVAGGATNRARMRFSFIVAAMRGSNLDNQNDIATMLDWTQTIRRGLHRAQPDWLAGDASARIAKIEVTEGRKFVDEAFRKMTDAFFFLIAVEADEPAGALP